MDGQGQPLVVSVTPASFYEGDQVMPLLTRIRQVCGRVPRLLVADKGYDSDKIRHKLTWWFDMGSVITKRGEDYDKQDRFKRFQVERGFAWQYRRYKRTTQRSERNPLNFIGWCHLSIMCFWIERVVG